MSDYYSVRIWQLRPGHTDADVESLASSGYLEMQRWIPGVKRISLLHSGGMDAIKHFVLTTTFVNYEAYTYWRQVEQEAADYWERYAAIAMQWECMCYLVGEYAGEIVLDVGLESGI